MTEAHRPIPFDNSYARLPGSMHVGVDPTPVSAPRLIGVNEPLARELGINPAALTAEVAVGNALLPGSTPIAQAYAGHQFGNFVPQLGDGRVMLIAREGEVAVGAPFVAGSQVQAEVVKHGRADKVQIIKFRRRKHHRKQMGHRQHYTEVEITGITG